MTRAVAGFFGFQRFANGAGDAVSRFRRRHDAFGFGECERRAESLQLRDGVHFQQILVPKLADDGRHAVITQAGRRAREAARIHAPAYTS